MSGGMNYSQMDPSLYKWAQETRDQVHEDMADEFGRTLGIPKGGEGEGPGSASQGGEGSS